MGVIAVKLKVYNNQNVLINTFDYNTPQLAFDHMMGELSKLFYRIDYVEPKSNRVIMRKVQGEVLKCKPETNELKIKNSAKRSVNLINSFYSKSIKNYGYDKKNIVKFEWCNKGIVNCVLSESEFGVVFSNGDGSGNIMPYIKEDKDIMKELSILVTLCDDCFNLANLNVISCLSANNISNAWISKLNNQYYQIIID